MFAVYQCTTPTTNPHTSLVIVIVVGDNIIIFDIFLWYIYWTRGNLTWLPHTSVIVARLCMKYYDKNSLIHICMYVHTRTYIYINLYICIQYNIINIIIITIIIIMKSDRHSVMMCNLLFIVIEFSSVSPLSLSFSLFLYLSRSLEFTLLLFSFTLSLRRQWNVCCVNACLPVCLRSAYRVFDGNNNKI
jgi:hypothetical protein